MAQSLGTQTRNVNMNRFGHANRRLQFYKRSQLFLRVHNETLSVAAMRVKQRRLFSRWNPRLRRSPNSNRLR